jgi:hypothetical protein
MLTLPLKLQPHFDEISYEEKRKDVLEITSTKHNRLKSIGKTLIA